MALTASGGEAMTEAAALSPETVMRQMKQNGVTIMFPKTRLPLGRS
jgi:hypothetical protein